MLDCMVEQVLEQKAFSREDTPTARRVLAAFLITQDCLTAD